MREKDKFAHSDLTQYTFLIIKYQFICSNIINHIQNIENTINQVKNPESLYSSRFLQDGIKSYFTRLEQARKIKREATDRLGNHYN